MDNKMTLFNKIKFRFPKLAEKLYNFAQSKKTDLKQDILLCTGVSAASAFYEFESFFLPAAVGLIRGTLIALTLFCWMWCAFINGFWKKYGFLIFTACFWIIPRIIIIWEENTGIRDYSKYLDVAAQFSRLISQYSLNGLGKFLNTPLAFVLPALFSWCLLFYIAGNAVSKKYRQIILKTLEK